ncbi:MAG: SGNH/GDSL hydrolase family protein [Nitrospinae bacterium]|nr:SGNH/GDSL hydrolase family protein [Nitrospinota bacterium]
MSARRCAALVVVFLLSAVTPVTASHLALRCTAPDEVTRFKVTLPNTARALRRGEALVIVAIGSSSTWPLLPVTVVNKGVGGEMAEQMLARFRRDVLPYRPQLVIWQTGTNQALKNEDVQSYEQTARKGIDQLKASQADVILMDPQYAPHVLGRRLHTAILDVLDGVANELHVAVFHRFAIMRHWVTSGQYTMGDIVSRDQLHMNDTSYSCIARLLADSLVSTALATTPAHAHPPVQARSGPAR